MLRKTNRARARRIPTSPTFGGQKEARCAVPTHEVLATSRPVFNITFEAVCSIAVRESYVASSLVSMGSASTTKIVDSKKNFSNLGISNPAELEIISTS